MKDSRVGSYLMKGENKMKEDILRSVFVSVLYLAGRCRRFLLCGQVGGRGVRISVSEMGYR